MRFAPRFNERAFAEAFSCTHAPSAHRSHRTEDAGRAAPLGNNTIFAATFKNKFENELLTMEVQGKQTLVRRDYKGKLHVVDVDGKKTLMFERQNAARLILGKKVR